MNFENKDLGKKLKSLADISSPKLDQTIFCELPSDIRITSYALEKAYAINKIVRHLYDKSYEWYGFTLGNISDPGLIVDVGMGINARNNSAYTRIEPEEIEKFRENLSSELIINGWIHSHGDLNFRSFSGTDESNHQTLLKYVSSRLTVPVAKREIRINNVSFLLNGQYDKEALKAGSVSVISDQPLKEIKLMEQVSGGFSYAIVIGDEGWSRQDIRHRYYGIMTKNEEISIVSNPGLIVLGEKNVLKYSDCKFLINEVSQKVKPDKEENTQKRRNSDLLDENIGYDEAVQNDVSEKTVKKHSERNRIREEKNAETQSVDRMTLKNFLKNLGRKI